MSTVLDYDQVVVMDKGAVVEPTAPQTLQVPSSCCPVPTPCSERKSGIPPDSVWMPSVLKECRLIDLFSIFFAPMLAHYEMSCGRDVRLGAYKFASNFAGGNKPQRQITFQSL